MTQYRVHLRRESTQIVDVDPADWPEEFAAGSTVVESAQELADSASWDYDDADVDAIEVSDDGETWRSLPASEVMRMECESSVSGPVEEKPR